MYLPAKPEAPEIARRALRSYLAEVGRPGTVEPDSGLPHFNRVRFALPGKPKVSIITRPRPIGRSSLPADSRTGNP